MPKNFVAELETNFAISAAPVAGADFRHINQTLLEHFFGRVKLATGKWVYLGYRWHAYSFGHESAITGKHAFEQYDAQPIQAFYIFHEIDDMLFDCVAESWPDIRIFRNDLYVFPHSLDWLFTTTHEMSMGLGPYFAVSNT